MSRFVRIFALIVVVIVIMGLQLQAQGYPQYDPTAREVVLPPEADHGHRVVLFMPEPIAVGAPENTVTVSNLTDNVVELDIKAYDAMGTNFNISREVIEPLGVLELSEDHLPAGSRLIAVEGSGAIAGVVSSIWPDGSQTQIGSLVPAANNLRARTRSSEDAEVADTIVINFEADRPATLLIKHDGIPSLSGGDEFLHVGPMEIKELPAGSIVHQEFPRSSVAMLIKRQVSEDRLDYLAVDQGNLASKNPYPGSTINIPFLCGGADTVNQSFCTGALNAYSDGKIHPALDIDKQQVEGAIRNNRVLATLPGTVVSVLSDVTCEDCSGWGNNVIIRHLLIDGRVVHSGYGHLLYTGGNQAAGLTRYDYVIGGQFAGYKGNTGASNGSHLHFEMMKSIDTFEGGYAPCSAHWTPPCQNGARTTAATGSTTTEDPAPYMNGQRRALLPYFSSTESVPTEANYDVYGVANRRLYGALPLTVERSEAWMIAGRSEAGETWDIPLPTNSGFVKTGYRDDLASDDDGTDYRFYAYYDHISFGGGYQIKFTMLPNSSSKIVDNDSPSGFIMNDGGTDGSGLSDQIAGYYYSAFAYEAHAGQYAKWQPTLSSGAYKIAIHIPKMPYGAKASAVRYKIYKTSTSVPVVSDPIDHRENHNQWVQLTANAGATQSWTFDSTGYVGLSIDQSGGNDGVAPGDLVGIDAVKFLAAAAPSVLASVLVSGPSSVNENTTGAFTSTATFSDGSTSTVTSASTWTENSSATTISTAGILSAGSISSNQAVVVTASYTYNGVTKSGSKTTTIVDVPKTLSSVMVSGPSSVNENMTGAFTSTATFSDGNTSTVTSASIWTENSSTTTISTAGVLSAGAVSSNQGVTVTASYTYSGVTKIGTKAVTIVDVPKTLSSVTVSGPSSVNENTTGAFTSTATFSDGSTSTVTSASTWTENSSTTTISTAGVLSAGSVSSNQAVTVTASYTYSGVTKSGTRAVTVVNIPTYTSSPAPGTYTSGGSVLKMKATFSGSTVTFTIAKQDGSKFTTSGVMTIRAGASYGCVANNNTYYWSFSSGSTTTTATFNLSQYFISGSKDLFAAIGRPSTYCDGTPPAYYSGRLTITAK